MAGHTSPQQMQKSQAWASVQAGRLHEAKERYAEICRSDPQDAEAWFMLGAVNGQLGLFDEVIACCRQAVAVNPDYAEGHYNLAQAYMHRNNPEAAVASYREVVRLQPQHAVALNNLGYALQQLGRHEEAASVHQQALLRQPNDPEILINLGNALQGLGKREDAAACYRQALQIRPDYAEGHFNLAGLRHGQGRLDEAIASYRQALRYRPNYFQALLGLGNAQTMLDEHKEAAECFRAALNLVPDSAEAHFHLGRSLRRLGSLGEAAEHMRQALRLKPDYVEARLAVGTILQAQGLQESAEAVFREMLRLDPACGPAHTTLLSSLNYHAADPVAVFREHQEWGRRHAPPPAELPPYRNKPDPERRLRIGYVSPDFRAHSVAFFFEPLLMHHDPARIEAICYADVARPDAVTARLQKRAGTWRNIFGLPDTEVAELIRQDEIDVLVDLTGHTALNRLLVFARKPAPVQVTYLGYPNTTGLSAMDYRFTDAWADPPGLTEHLHTETLVRLPRGFLCYLPPPGLPRVTSALPAYAAGHITFGSFNNLAKVTPEVIALWARILRAVPGARLLLKNDSLRDAQTRKRIYKVFAGHAVDRSRLELAGWQPMLGEHLPWYDRLDLALDTFPYNGTTTTCEALWMGVPVITLAGRTHAGRVGVSLLSQAGLTGFIAADPEGYVACAVHWANDREGLARLRGEMRNRLASSAWCDGAAFARDVERAYREMWRTWCRGRSRPCMN